MSIEYYRDQAIFIHFSMKGTAGREHSVSEDGINPVKETQAGQDKLRSHVDLPPIAEFVELVKATDEEVVG